MTEEVGCQYMQLDRTKGVKTRHGPPDQRDDGACGEEERSPDMERGEVDLGIVNVASDIIFA